MLVKTVNETPEDASIIGVQACPCGNAILVFIPKPDMIEAGGHLIPSAHMPLRVAIELATEIMNKSMSAVMHRVLGDLEPGDGQ